jgi:hypothetical protein
MQNIAASRRGECLKEREPDGELDCLGEIGYMKQQKGRN